MVIAMTSLMQRKVTKKWSTLTQEFDRWIGFCHQLVSTCSFMACDCSHHSMLLFLMLQGAPSGTSESASTAGVRGGNGPRKNSHRDNLLVMAAALAALLNLLSMRLSMLLSGDIFCACPVFEASPSGGELIMSKRPLIVPLLCIGEGTAALVSEPRRFAEASTRAYPYRAMTSVSPRFIESKLSMDIPILRGRRRY